MQLVCSSSTAVIPALDVKTLQMYRHCGKNGGRYTGQTSVESREAQAGVDFRMAVNHELGLGI